MRSDSDIKQDVEEELRWQPGIHTTDVAVAVSGGIVTLTGFVPGYIDKVEAEDAAKRIAGVVGVANDIEVRLPGVDERPDPELAREAVAAIKRHLPFSAPHIKVVVNDGWIMLEGEVSWNHVREKAWKAVHRLAGVKGITDLIGLKPKVAPAEIKEKIEAALRRSAEVDAKRIQVEAHGGEVILKGTVRSWIEREEAEHAAWAAPGVVIVEDQISISP